MKSQTVRHKLKNKTINKTMMKTLLGERVKRMNKMNKNNQLTADSVFKLMIRAKMQKSMTINQNKWRLITNQFKKSQ